MAKKQQIVRRIKDGDAEFIVVKPDFIENLAAELEKVKRERDALMHDLRIVGNNSFSVCVVCKHGDPCAVACPRADVDCLEWRGLCKENGGAE